MDKRQQRTQKKKQTILQTASDLFMQYGVDKVGMDEIADKANVSKVTIYKYFGSKQALYSEVIHVFIDQTLSETEALLNSDANFLEKLKSILFLKTNSLDLVKMERLFQLWDENEAVKSDVRMTLQDKVKDLMYQFYRQGIDGGYINKDVSFEALYLYADIVRTGMRARQIDLESSLVDKDMLEQLIDIYFFGFVNRQ